MTDENGAIIKRLAFDLWNKQPQPMGLSRSRCTSSSSFTPLQAVKLLPAWLDCRCKACSE